MSAFTRRALCRCLLLRAGHCQVRLVQAGAWRSATLSCLFILSLVKYLVTGLVLIALHGQAPRCLGVGLFSTSCAFLVCLCLVGRRRLIPRAIYCRVPRATRIPRALPLLRFSQACLMKYGPRWLMLHKFHEQVQTHRRAFCTFPLLRALQPQPRRVRCRELTVSAPLPSSSPPYVSLRPSIATSLSTSAYLYTVSCFQSTCALRPMSTSQAFFVHCLYGAPL